MKIFFKLFVFAFLSYVSVNAAAAQAGIICGNPKDKGCQPQYEGFAPHDLSFLTGRAKLGTGTLHQSEEFYAVILESVKAASNKNRMGCAFFDEARRRAAQRLFPANKVFASRNSCVGTIVIYEGADNQYNFLAVYGGKTENAAEKILARAKKKYPSARIEKIRVSLDFADE